MAGWTHPMGTHESTRDCDYDGCFVRYDTDVPSDSGAARLSPKSSRREADRSYHPRRSSSPLRHTNRYLENYLPSQYFYLPSQVARLISARQAYYYRISQVHGRLYLAECPCSSQISQDGVRKQSCRLFILVLHI